MTAFQYFPTRPEMTPEHLEWYAALEAAEVAKRTRVTPPRAPVEVANAAMAEHISKALMRAREWAFFHAERASEKNRDLPESEDAFMAAGEIFGLLADSALSHGIRDSLNWCASRAFNVACIITEMERGGGLYPEAKRHQVVECNSSEIRELLLVVDTIWSIHFCMAEEGSLSPHEAWIASADALISAPFPPPEQDEAQ